jgi:hypothetical protein
VPPQTDPGTKATLAGGGEAVGTSEEERRAE